MNPLIEQLLKYGYIHEDIQQEISRKTKHLLKKKKRTFT